MPKPTTLLILLMPILTGCASPDATVSGMVTVDNATLKRGHITLYPVDGTGAIRGAEIVDGSFELKPLPIGPRKAVITTTPNVQVVSNGDKGATLKILSNTQAVTSKTKGNDQIVEIGQGKQTLDFALHNPVRPTR